MRLFKPFNKLTAIAWASMLSVSSAYAADVVTITDVLQDGVPQTVSANATSTEIDELVLSGGFAEGDVTWNDLNIALSGGDTYSISKLEVRFDGDEDTNDTTIRERCAEESDQCEDFIDARIWNNLYIQSITTDFEGRRIIATSNLESPNYEVIFVVHDESIPAVPSIECDPGLIVVDGQCVEPVQCRDDQINDNNTCVCPAGEEEISGICQVPVQCRDDQIIIDNNCACPAGETEIDGICQVPVQCRADQIIVNNTCQCPAGEIDLDGQCQTPPPVITPYELTSAYLFNEAAGQNTFYSTANGDMEKAEATGVLTGTVNLGSDLAPAAFQATGDWTLTVGDNAIIKANETCTDTDGDQITVCEQIIGDWIGDESLPLTITQDGNQIIAVRESFNGSFNQTDTIIFTQSSDVISCAAGELQIGNSCEALQQCPDGLIFNNVFELCQEPAQCRDDQVVNEINRCVCPAGEVEIDGLCQIPAPECRDDQVVVDGQCVCPSGETEIGGICQANPQTVYVLTNATFSNLFGSGTYDIFSGSLADDNGTLSGDVAIEYVSGTAGFDYTGSWTTSVGSNTVFKANESCTNTGSQDACGPIVGDRATDSPVSQSGNTITIIHVTGGFPSTTETYTFTAQ